MNMNKFINEFEENVVFAKKDTLTIDTNLESLEDWDSMAIVSTIALIDDLFGVQVDAINLTECKTLGNVISLIKDALEE